MRVARSQKLKRAWLACLGIAIVALILVSKADQLEPSKVTKPEAQQILWQQHTYSVFTVDPEKHHLELYYTDGHGNRLGSFRKIQDLLSNQNRQLVFAINGGMFTPDFKPSGLFIEHGTTVHFLNTDDAEGNFFLKPNGVFYIGEKSTSIVTTSAFGQVSDYVHFATQSGPMLVHESQIHEAFQPDSQSIHIRSGVGIRSDQRVVFVLSNEAVNFYDFALFFKQRMGCEHALYLDGVICKMYLPALNRYQTDGDFAVMIGLAVP